MITFYCWISPPDRDKLTDSILHSPRSTTLPRVRMNEKVSSSLQNKSEVARFTASTCAKLAVFISCWSRVAPWLVAEGFGVCVSECGLFFIGPFLSRPQRALHPSLHLEGLLFSNKLGSHSQIRFRLSLAVTSPCFVFFCYFSFVMLKLFGCLCCCPFKHVLTESASCAEGIRSLGWL